jgi:hypothetical protein
VCVENPIMHGYARRLVGAAPTQVIQPWQFGVPEKKATCLWLKGLSPLKPAVVREPNDLRQSVWKEPPGPWQGLRRSVTSRGIAVAMAEQWG